MRKTTKMVAVLAAMSVMVLGAATMVSAAEKKQGWVKEGSDWYYYNDDKAIINGWAQDGAGEWYFLSGDGKMAKESFVDDDALLVVDSSELGNSRDYYYVDANGVMVTGWEKAKTGTSGDGPTKADDTKWRYFGTDGKMYTDAWVLSGDDWYYVLSNGLMAEKYLLTNNGDDSEDYYLAKGGAMVTGWYKVTSDDTAATALNLAVGTWVYADNSGALVEDGWKKVNDSWYYFGSTVGTKIVSPSAVSGTLTVAGTYEMNADGFVKVGSDIFHLKASGAMSTGTFKFDDKEYYANSKGQLQKGLQTIGGRNYYYNVETFVKSASKYVTYDGTTYTEQADVTPYNGDTTAKAASSASNHVYKLGTGTIWK